MMSCQFLLNNEVNQQYVSVYSLPAGSTPCPYPSTITVIQVLTEHRAELPMLYSNFPLVIYFTHGGAHSSVCLPIHPNPLPSLHVHSSILSVCISIPALQIDSSAPFFQIPHICVLIYDICFSLSDFSLCDSLSVHPRHYRWPSIIPFYG